MEKKLELLTVIVASLTIVSMNISIMQSNKEILKRLALNQKKIDVVRNLVRIWQGNVNNVEKFLGTRFGYDIHSDTRTLDEQLRRDYENEDTGF